MTDSLRSSEYTWTFEGRNHAHEYLLPALLEEIERMCPEGRNHVCDLGCGNGFVASQLSERGYSVLGVDSSLSGIRIARAAYPGVRFEEGSIYDESLGNRLKESSDCVVAMEVIEHLTAPRKLLELSFRILKPGGHLILTTPYHGYFKNLALSLLNAWDRHFGVHDESGHIKFFSKKTLSTMARGSGFHVVRFRGAGRLPGLWKSMMLVAQRPS